MFGINNEGFNNCVDSNQVSEKYEQQQISIIDTPGWKCEELAGGLKHNEIVLIRSNTKRKILNSEIASCTMVIKNIHDGLEDSEILVREDSTKIPPKGRTQKAHNLIQNMNKRKR